MTERDNTEDKKSDDEAQAIELQRQPIELYKILKFEGLVGSGGEAKAAIAAGMVEVNDAIETQKRKQMVAGDSIRFDGNLFVLHCEFEPTPKKAKPEKPVTVKPKAKKKDWRRKPNAKKSNGKASRKAIGIKAPRT